LQKVIISTVGTSLITNPAAKEEKSTLYEYANCREQEYPEEYRELIDRLYTKAGKAIKDSPRSASAELNGIFALYGSELPDQSKDMHFLISTDTLQGEKSALLVKEYLNAKFTHVEVIKITNLNTRDKASFSEGIKELSKWCGDTLPGYKQSGYQIIFNLTGGFKALQGYMNIIAMLYEAKISYIFESKQVELIEVPRLPIKIDTRFFEDYKEDLLSLNANKIYSENKFKDYPEAVFDVIEGNVMFSMWGKALWDRIKSDLFEQPPKLPCIKYENKFIKEFRDERDKRKRIDLIETIADVSVKFEEARGNIKSLTNGGLQFSPLVNKPPHNGRPVFHFRVNKGIRINCIVQEQFLLLTEVGTHDETQR